jgi:hypothetical protein
MTLSMTMKYKANLVKIEKWPKKGTGLIHNPYMGNW